MILLIGSMKDLLIEIHNDYNMLFAYFLKDATIPANSGSNIQKDKFNLISENHASMDV